MNISRRATYDLAASDLFAGTSNERTNRPKLRLGTGGTAGLLAKASKISGLPPTLTSMALSWCYGDNGDDPKEW